MPEMRWILAGCERADSFIVNPHKWLFTPLDCSVLYTKHQQQLKAAFSLVPEYLSNAQGGTEEVPNLMDYGNALGRRFRSLKLWMILRYFGQEGLAARLREDAGPRRFRRPVAQSGACHAAPHRRPALA